MTRSLLIEVNLYCDFVHLSASIAFVSLCWDAAACIKGFFQTYSDVGLSCLQELYWSVVDENKLYHLSPLNHGLDFQRFCFINFCCFSKVSLGCF